MFIAAMLPDTAIAALEAVQREVVSQLGGDVARATAREQLHLTLAFLGNREEAQAGRVIDAMERHLAGVVAPQLELRPPERFGGGSVIACTIVGQGLSQLTPARDALERELVDGALMADEGRAWRPHVTIVRGRGRRRLRLPDIAVDPVAFRVTRVELIASLPAGRGRRYEPRASLGLRADAPPAR